MGFRPIGEAEHGSHSPLSMSFVLSPLNINSIATLSPHAKHGMPFNAQSSITPSFIFITCGGSAESLGNGMYLALDEPPIDERGFPYLKFY